MHSGIRDLPYLCGVRVLDNPLINAGIAQIILMLFCYAFGRLHQWYRTTAEREMAFRDGYDTATKSLFSLAARTAMRRPAPRGEATVHTLAPVRADGSERRPQTRRPRHRASAERKSLSQTKILDREAA